MFGFGVGMLASYLWRSFDRLKTFSLKMSPWAENSRGNWKSSKILAGCGDGHQTGRNHQDHDYHHCFHYHSCKRSILLHGVNHQTKFYLHKKARIIKVLALQLNTTNNKVDWCLARYSPHAEANNSIPCNTIQYCMIWYGTMRYNTIQCYICSTIQYKAMACNTIRYHTILCNTNIIRCDAMPCIAILHCNTMHPTK